MEHNNIQSRMEQIEKNQQHEKNTAKTERSALLERHTKLERDYYTSTISMQKDIEQIKECLKENKEDHAKIFKKIDDFIEAVDKKIEKEVSNLNKTKAGKWVELPLIGMSGIIGTAIVVALLALILK